MTPIWTKWMCAVLRQVTISFNVPYFHLMCVVVSKLVVLLVIVMCQQHK